MSSDDEKKDSDRKDRNEKRKSRSGESNRRRDLDEKDSWRRRPHRDNDRRSRRSSGNSEDDDDRRDACRRSRSPRRDERRVSYSSNRRNNNKPFVPQRPKLFQRPADPSTSNEATKNWSTRIAAVATDDSQRSKFEKLLGIRKTDSKPTVANKNEQEEESTNVKKVQEELQKMHNDLDSQYVQARAFTHSFRGRGL
ncbi:hypothetical protein M3Y98_00433100 [Aphelenchoides besseyi]|nr:hypothetical protein M3Y98_00433100 [Aphelenchoides besseyi]KAI6202511.1 hypothetical protein M3Y96_00956800 [Aphelenchoides besseyi]